MEVDHDEQTITGMYTCVPGIRLGHAISSGILIGRNIYAHCAFGAHR